MQRALKRKRLSTRIVEYLEDNFFRKKLNSWFGYLVVALLAILFGLLLAKNLILGLGLFGIIAGLIVAIVCMKEAEIGIYITLFYSFFAFFFSRLFFKGNMPVGVIFDGLVLATFLGVMMKGIEFKRNFLRFAKTPIVVGILFLLFFLAIELFNPYSRSFDSWNLTFRKFCGYVLLLFSCYQVFNSYEKIRRFITFLFLVALASALYGCIQQWHGYFDFEMQLILSDPHGFGLIFIDGEFRKYSTMSDPAAFGILMAVCAVVFIVLGIYEKDKRIKWTLLVGSIFMILATGYSGTRTAYAVIVAGIAFYLLLNFDKKQARVLGFIACIIFLMLMYAPIPGKAVYRFRTTFMGTKDESYKVRVESRKWIQPYILSHPIGGGLGTTGATGVSQHAGHYLANFQPDSSYLKKAAETGWIGLAIVCLIYYIVLRTGLRYYFRSRSDHIKVMYAAIITGLFAFYVAEYAQVALGQITDVVVYYPMIAIVLRLKEFDRQPYGKQIQSESE